MKYLSLIVVVVLGFGAGTVNATIPPVTDSNEVEHLFDHKRQLINGVSAGQSLFYTDTRGLPDLQPVRAATLIAHRQPAYQHGYHYRKGPRRHYHRKHHYYREHPYSHRKWHHYRSYRHPRPYHHSPHSRYRHWGGWGYHHKRWHDSERQYWDQFYNRP